MGRREEIERLSQIVYESEDLPTLERTQQEIERLLQAMRQNLQATTDEDVVNLLNELIEQADGAGHELKQKIAAIRVDMMDPSYAARQAERARESAAQQAKADEMTRKIQEGIGGFLGGLGLGGAFGLGNAKPAAPAATATTGAASAPAPSATCAQCGAALGGSAKFCPECGAPAAREKRCAGCGARLEAGAKFCPDCGTRAV